MALLDWINEATGPVVKGQGVTLRPPRLSDHEAWAAERLASHAYLQPWEPIWPEDDLTRAAFKRRLAIYSREMEAGNAWPFFIFADSDQSLVGAVAWAFSDLNLHRIEAACVPTNVASRRVLEKTGFMLEGQARAYLKINGAWADHLLFGVVNDGAGRGG